MSVLALSCSLNPFPGCAQWFCLLQCHDVIAYDSDVLLYLGAQAMNQRDHILYAPQHIHPNLQVCLLIEVLDANIYSICSSEMIDWSFFRVMGSGQCYFTLLRGAWTDRDTNDIFAHCSLIFYFLDFKFSNFVCPSKLHPFIWSFFKNSFRKKKNIWKTTQNALAPSIFVVLSIVLKLGTPLLHTQAQNILLQNF